MKLLFTLVLSPCNPYYGGITQAFMEGLDPKGEVSSCHDYFMAAVQIWPKIQQCI